MVEASIVKYKVIYDKKLDPMLLAVAEYDDEAMNIKYKFDWETFHPMSFFSDLREEIAEKFDIAVKFVDVRSNEITPYLQESYMKYLLQFGKVLH